MVDLSHFDKGRQRFIWIPASFYLCAIIVFVKTRKSLLQFPLDDAWIHRVYSRSFAQGHGFAYNPGVQEAGSSSPLWAIVSAPCHWLETIDPDLTILGVKILGVLLGLISVLMVHRIVNTMTGSVLSAVISASLFAVEPKLLYSSFSGMETNLLIVLLIGSCLAIMKRKIWLFLFLTGLASTVRPEAVFFLPLASLAFAEIRYGRHPFIRTIIACLLLVMPIVCWSIFCYSINGHFLPNTFYIKAISASMELSIFADGLRTVGQYGEIPGLIIMVGIASFCLLCYRIGRAAIPPFAFLFATPFVYIFSVVFSRNFLLSSYYYTRWTDPGTLLVNVAASVGLGWLLGSHNLSLLGENRNRFFSRVTRIILPLMFCAILARTLIPSFLERRDRLASDCHAIETINVKMGQWINRNTRTDAIISANDAGAIRYFGDRYTLDLGGLNNSDIAFGKLPLWIAIQKSDWLVVFPGFLHPDIWAQLKDKFEIRFTTTMDAEEYTVSPITGTRLYHFAIERLTGKRAEAD